MEVSEIYAQAALPAGNNSVTQWIENWVCPRASLGVLEKKKSLLPLPGFEPWTRIGTSSLVDYDIHKYYTIFSLTQLTVIIDIC
jgi:hypothetical protein